jgi:WD40 repeat protein
MSRLPFALLALSCSALPAWPAGPPASAEKSPLPSGARLRIGTALLRHGGLIRAVAFAPDGKLLASASHDHTLSVWRLGPPVRELYRFRGHAGDVLCVAFSGDGRVVASGGADGSVRLWSVQGPTAGQEVRALTGKAEAVEALAFSPNGKVLAAGGDDGVLRLYDARSHDLLKQMSQDRAVRCLAWSADGKAIATNGASHAVALWDADKGSLLKSFGDEAINCLCFAPAGRELVTWEPGGVLRAWDPEKGTLMRTWGGGGDDSSGGLIYQIAFGKDGKTLFAGTAAGPIDVWDPATGKRRGRLVGHQGRSSALGVAPVQALVASGGADGTLRLWDATTNKEVSRTVEPAAPIVSLSVAPKSDRTAVVLSTGELQLWDRATGKRLRSGFKGKAVQLAFGTDGLANVVDGKGRLLRWDLKKEAAPKDAAGVTGLALAPDGARLATTHRDGSVRLFDAKGASLRVLPNRERRAVAAVGPRGARVAVLAPAAAVVWNGRTGKPEAALAGHRGGTTAGAFSPDGKSLATGGRDRMLRVWDLPGGKERRIPSGHTAWVCSVAFSPDGKLLVSATVEGDIHVWAAKSGRLLRDLEGHRGPVTGLVFADDKTLLSSGRDASVLVWDVAGLSEGRVVPVNLTQAQRERYWGLLLHDDTAAASLAMQRLARDPRGVVGMLRNRLQPVDGRRIAKLLDELDARDFKTRKAAFAGLEAMGRFAERPLRQALAKKPNLEKHRRIEELLDKFQDEKLTSEHLRALRSVEVLEMIGTAEARKVLQALAGGAEEADLTRKAKSSLGRMKR